VWYPVAKQQGSGDSMRGRLAGSTIVVLLLAIMLSACRTDAVRKAPGATAPPVSPISAVTVATVGSPISTASSTIRDTGTSLEQRPLRLPALAAGAVCPLTPGKQMAQGIGSMHGDGPVYVIFDGSPRGPSGILSYAPPDYFNRDYFGTDTPWGGQKVLIAARPDYRAAALLRGRQLDGANPVRFTGEASPHPDPDPSAELRLPSRGGGASPAAPGWHLFGTTVRLSSPGCYGLQIDGTGFSEVIVFQAELLPSPPTPTPRPGGKQPSTAQQT
jgi:hypothetical protein